MSQDRDTPKNLENSPILEEVIDLSRNMVGGIIGGIIILFLGESNLLAKFTAAMMGLVLMIIYISYILSLRHK